MKDFDLYFNTGEL